jgi:hypothetical protein
VLTGKTDATGNFTLPLTTSGTYTVAYLKDGAVVKVVEIKSLPKASPGAEEGAPPTTATGLDALGGATVGMVALLAIVVAGVVIMLIGKGKEKPKGA